MLTVQSAQSYLWSTGDTTQSIVVTQSGSYQVTVTDTAANHISTGILTVQFLPIPDVSLNLISPNGMCLNTPLSNSGTNYPGMIYTWFYNDSLLPNEHGFSIIPADTGNYKLEGSNGCGTDADSVRIDTFYTVPLRPQLSSSYLTICPGDSVMIATPDSGLSYQWYFQISSHRYSHS